LSEMYPEYGDMWPALRSNKKAEETKAEPDDQPEQNEEGGAERGLTFDTVANKMLHKHMFEQMRYDRILLKSKEQTGGGHWTGKTIEMLGTESFMNDRQGFPVNPSDHFGLFLEIEYKRS